MAQACIVILAFLPRRASFDRISGMFSSEEGAREIGLPRNLRNLSYFCSHLGGHPPCLWGFKGVGACRLSATSHVVVVWRHLEF